jgi:hypothetical protein
MGGKAAFLLSAASHMLASLYCARRHRPARACPAENNARRSEKAPEGRFAAARGRGRMNLCQLLSATPKKKA